MYSRLEILKWLCFEEVTQNPNRGFAIRIWKFEIEKRTPEEISFGMTGEAEELNEGCGGWVEL